MVGLRMRLAKNSLITARQERVFLTSLLPEFHSNLVQGQGARSPGEMFAMIIEATVAKLAEAAEHLDEEMYELRKRHKNLQVRKRHQNLQARSFTASDIAQSRRELLWLRQDVLRMVRWVRPQEQAMVTLLRWLSENETDLLDRVEVLRVRESTARLRAVIEMLQACESSGALLEQEAASLRAELDERYQQRLGYIGLLLAALGLVSVVLDVYEKVLLPRTSSYSEDADIEK